MIFPDKEGVNYDCLFDLLCANLKTLYLLSEMNNFEDRTTEVWDLLRKILALKMYEKQKLLNLFCEQFIFKISDDETEALMRGQVASV